VLSRARTQQETAKTSLLKGGVFSSPGLNAVWIDQVRDTLTGDQMAMIVEMNRAANKEN